MAEGTHPGGEVGERLAYLLKRAFLDLEELHRQHLAPMRMSSREFGLLLHLDDREPGSQQEVAAGLGIDRTTMVGLLDELEAKGFVARQADPADRRRNVVVVTPAGRQALQRAVRVSDAAEQQLLGDLDDTEVAQLRSLLTRITTQR